MSTVRVADTLPNNSSDPLGATLKVAPESVEGESVATDAAAVASTEQSDAVSATITREVLVEIRGSLAKLASSGQTARWGVDECAHDIFQASATDKGFAHCAGDCDISNAVLHRLQIKNVRSTFPCAVGVNISGVAGKSFCKEGKAFAQLVLQDTVSNVATPLVTPDEMTNSEYLKKYPGMTRQNLSKVGIVSVPGEDYVFVDSNHPIVEMLQVNSTVLQVDMSDAQLIDGRWYKVSQQVVEDCTKLLDQQLLQHLPIVNLEDFSVTIERANNESWDSVAQVADHVPVDSAAYDQQLERIMTKTNTFQLVIEMEYGFM